MKILYIASAITLPDRSGGATHVREVAEGLAARGHEVHVLARAGKPQEEISSWGWRVSGGEHGATRHENGQTPAITFHGSALPDKLAVLSLPAAAQLANEIGADVIMERFYNFAGAGSLVAKSRGLPYVLEVNAPMIDPPDALKSRIDGLLFGSMRRWAVSQAAEAARIVTPLNTTVPPEIDRGKIVELPWGANVGRFTPAIRATRGPELVRLRGRLGIPADAVVAVFVGSFRAWHGVQQFADAATRLIASHPKLYFLAVGGGPELKDVRASMRGDAGRLVFTGPQKHERIPAILALADIGVAPFVPAVYAPLRTFGFYWSPLKVFEYMATGLPVVTISIPPLDRIVRAGQEGLLYPAGDVAALSAAIARLADDATLRQELGSAARSRVVEHFSWAAHCAQLERVLEEAIEERR